MGLLDELKKLTKPYSGEEYDDFEDDYPDAPAEMPLQPEPPARKSTYNQERRGNPFSEYEGGRGYENSRGYEGGRGYDSGRGAQRSRDYGGGYEGSRYDPRNAPPPQSRDKVVNLNPNNQIKMVILKPERFEAAAEIADHIRERHPVLVNLERADKETSRRLIDFLSGVAYALDAKVKKAAVNTFVVAPYNVDLTGDFADDIENNNLYF